MRKTAALHSDRLAGQPSLVARQSGRPASLALPIVLALVAYIALFNQLGSFPLFDVDEGAFSEATREMLERGDFVTTYLNGQLRFDKPILVYWLQALSVTLLGINEFAFRLPSALASLGWIGAIFVFTRQQSDRVTGYAAALIAATTLGLGVIGRGATADALLNLFLALSMFDIGRYLSQPLAQYRRRAFFWIALGVLAKGPIALLIPLVASGVAFALQGKLRQWGKALLDPLAWLILLAVAAPWYGLEYQREGDAFIAGFFMRHNVERFMSPLQGHHGGLLYYIPVLLLLLLPYSGLFLRIVPRVRALRSSQLDTLLWCWFGFVLLFFSLAGTKLPHYVLYGVTPLFVLMALHRESLVTATLAMRTLAYAPPVLLLTAVIALPHALALFGPTIGNPYVREALTRNGVFGGTYHLWAAVLLLALLALLSLPRLPPWQKLIGAGVLCALATGGLVLPALAELQQGPVKEAAMLARQAGWPVRSWQINMPSFSVYRGAPTPVAGSLRPGEVVLTRSSELPFMGPVQVLYRKGGVLLVRIPG
jgi:4-amino-4-deoxy-L-arabinose transferase-like glycosyltransferase